MKFRYTRRIFRPNFSKLSFKVFLLLMLLFWFFSFNLWSAEIFKDSFTEGKTQLQWMFFPHYFLDNLEAVKDPTAPEGDRGIGILTNSKVGGFAALSYAITPEVSDFYLEAMVYCPVSEGDKGPLVGLAFLIDPIEGRFYRFVCDFNKKSPSLNLAYVGKDTRHFPVYLKFWKETDISNQFPKESGWQKMGLRVKKGKAIFYWNDRKLEGVLDVSRIKKGLVGIYTNFVGGLGKAEAKVDYFLLEILK